MRAHKNQHFPVSSSNPTQRSQDAPDDVFTLEEYSEYFEEYRDLPESLRDAMLRSQDGE